MCSALYTENLNLVGIFGGDLFRIIYLKGDVFRIFFLIGDFMDTFFNSYQNWHFLSSEKNPKLRIMILVTRDHFRWFGHANNAIKNIFLLENIHDGREMSNNYHFWKKTL